MLVLTDPDEKGNAVVHGRASSQLEQDALWPVIIAWRRWRHSRPFWGGFFVLLGGAVILLSERAPLPLIVHIGSRGVAGYLVSVVMLLCGLLLWFSPAQRTFYSVLAVLLALGSWITSNLGGFVVGMMLGLVGGSLAFAWQPHESPSAQDQEEPKHRPTGLSLIIGESGSEEDAGDAGQNAGIASQLPNGWETRPGSQNGTSFPA